MSNLLKDLLKINLLKEDETPAPPAVQAAANPPTNPEPAVTTTVTPAAPKQDAPLEEQTEYADSGEFTDEFYGMIQSVTDAEKILKSQKFKHWMGITDTNFSTDLAPLVENAIEACDALVASFTALEAELDKAE